MTKPAPTRVTFAYLQDKMPENAVCALHDVRFRDYLVWRLRGWVKPKLCPMALGEFASGFQLTAKGRNADVGPRSSAELNTLALTTTSLTRSNVGPNLNEDNMANSTKTRVTFAYLQDKMPENAVCAFHDVRFRDYLVWRLRGWVKPKLCPMALGEFASGFQLTAKGRDADVGPRSSADDATAFC